MMTDGVFCEFAIFELEELANIPYSPGRFVWRRDEVSESIANPVRAMPALHSPDWLLGEIISNLVIGLSRLARGEKLAAMRMIQVYALDRLLELFEQKNSRLDATNVAVSRDPFNIDRRVEARLLMLKASLSQAAGGYDKTARAAQTILEIAVTLMPIPQEIITRITELIKIVDA
jgi:hypothetical protein